jgi:hypothetical protein
MDRSCSQNEEGRSAFEILTEKGSLGWFRRKWEDSRMDLKVGINTRNWFDSA